MGLKRWVVYAVLNTAFLTAIYFAVFVGHDGAKNLAMFYAWFCAVVGTTLAFDAQRAIARWKKDGHQAPPQWLEFVIDLLAVMAMVYGGWFVTAAAFLIGELLAAGVRSEYSKSIKE
jgi:hypothetical protein